MNKLLILGHKGMLGNAVYKYFFNLKNYKVYTLNTRFGNDDFTKEILSISPDFIINCIGVIPQKKPKIDLYRSINIDLPVLLEGLDIKIIHPSTDCEFLGDIEVSEKYSNNSVRNAEDEYGKSKAEISEKIEKEFQNTKIIRTSIIGHELNTNKSLLNWFLSQDKEVNGYVNYFWNGITTLEWAKSAQRLIENWHQYGKLTQLSTDDMYSKYDLLQKIKKTYNKDIIIHKIQIPKTINKCLKSDITLPKIEIQLHELKRFYE